MDITEFKPLIRKLKSALKKSDTDAVEHFQKLQACLSHVGLDQELRELESSLDEFDFDGILEAIEGFETALHRKREKNEQQKTADPDRR